MQRPFASGSRQAPDPYDQYLEQEGFYRKHTARDSTCLFRTISEQMYDTQLYHLSMRQACVDYMRKHKHVFQQSIDKYIDEYLDEMSKPKTFGTLLELRAMAYLYRRNVLLFEAYNTGTWMVREPGFSNVFRVFFTPEKHFDSVFTNEFIEIAAFCQSICYEILYKNVFKLPDVTYAVEQMLHASSFDYVHIETEYEGDYEKRILLDDGRAFDFDQPDDTCCILDNYKLCHFHNPNFTQFTDTLNQDMCLVEKSNNETHRATRTIDALLPEKYISCVRQLLNEGITPFPYKVAKALDPDIYRNIEFDAWSEQRKEQRFKNWYTGGSNFQVGVKCLVKLRNSQPDLYTCHIQEMSPEKGPCWVYIEDLGEKHIVPYDYLQPLPSEQAKPWPLPFRYQRHIEKYPSKFIITEIKKNQRNCNGKGKTLEISHSYDLIKSSDIFADEDCLNEKDGIVNKLKQYTTFQHFQPAPIELVAMPLSIDRRNIDKNNRRNSDNSRISHTSGPDGAKQDNAREDDSELDCVQSPENYSCSFGYPPESYYPYSYDSSIIHAGSHNMMSSAPPYYCMYNPAYSPSSSTVSHSVYVPPFHCAQGPSGFYPPAYIPIPSSSSSGVTSAYSVTSATARHNISVSSTGRINYSAVKSEEESGADLPKDVATLRYFYNLGCEYFKKKFGNSSNAPETPAIENDEKKDELSRVTTDLENNFKIESGCVSANSQNKVDANNNIPPSQGQSGRRFQSRYFNNKKERQGYRGGNRYSSSDYNKTSNNKNFNSSNTGHKNTSSTNTLVSADQGIQTSPITSSESNEHAQLSSTYNIHSSASHTPYIPVFPTEGDQQSGVLVSQAVMPVPCGVYAPPPPHPSHATAYPAYVGPAAPQSIPIQAASYPPHAQPTYYPSPVESSSVVGAESLENGHYAVMSYSPVYYSPNNGGTSHSAAIPQGYWYTAPPPPLPSSVAIAPANPQNTTNNTSH